MLARLLAPSPGVSVSSRVERILVTKQHNQMGDFIVASPLIANLARLFPRAAIDVLASPIQAEVAGLVPEVRRVWLVETNGITKHAARLAGVVRALRRERYDLAIAVVTFSYSTTTAVLLALSGARFRIAGRISQSPRGRSFFHREVVLQEGGHETDRALAHLAAIGAEPSTRTPRLAATREEIETARVQLAARGWGPSDAVVAIHPGAGKRLNRWPAPLFGEVARRLLARDDTRLILLAGPGEEPLLEAMGVPPGPRVAWMSGYPIRQVAAFLHNAALFLGNDTGKLHLAAAVGVPTLGLFGPTDPAVWAPVSAAGRSLRAAGGDLARLSADLVDKELETMLVRLYSERH